MLRAGLWIIAGVATWVLSLWIQEDLTRSFPYPSVASASTESAEELRLRLRREPLQATVLRELAMRNKRPAHLIELAQRVSRRDPLTQLLLIERTTAEGDVAATLAHYAVLLETSPALRQGIITVIGNAAREQDVFEALETYRDQPWFASAVSRMIAQAETGERALALLSARPSARDALTAPDQIAQLIGLMLKKPDPQHAFRITGLQNNENRELYAFGFTSASTNGLYGPLTWKLAEIATLAGPTANALRIVAEPNVITDVAERYTNLASGEFRLEGQLSAYNSMKLQLQWIARCIGGGTPRTILASRVNVEATGERFAFALTIPDLCPVQHWRLSTLGDDAAVPSVVTLSETQIRPAN